jgi:hypothetical protein
METCSGNDLDAKRSRKSLPVFDLPPRLNGRKCRTNLFNEVAFSNKRPKFIDHSQEDADYDRRMPPLLGAADVASMATAMQFVFPWLPYQCLIRMRIAVKSHLFADVMRKTVTELRFDAREQETRRARVETFKLFRLDQPDVPAPFTAIRRRLSVVDFPNVTKIIVPFPPRLEKFEPVQAHAVPHFDLKTFAEINAFKRLTHLYLSVEPTMTSYWRRLPTSLEHLCIIRRPQTFVPKMLNFSKLVNLKSLCLQSGADYYTKRVHLGVNAFPHNLVSLKVDFEWHAKALCLLPPTLEVFCCHNLQTEEDAAVDKLVAEYPDRVVPTLLHIGVSSYTFNVNIFDYFPSTVTSVAVTERCVPVYDDNGMETRVGSTVDYTRHAMNWKRLVLTTCPAFMDSRMFSVVGIDQTILSLHMNVPIDDLASGEWKRLAAFRQIKVLSLQVRANMWEPRVSTIVDIPPLVESMAITFIGQNYLPQQVNVPLPRGVEVLTRFMSCLRLGPLVKTLRLDIYDSSMITDTWPIAMCPEFAKFESLLPKSLELVTFNYRHKNPQIVSQSSTCDKRFIRDSVAVLKKRGIQTKVFFCLDNSSATNNMMRFPCGDDALDDFDAMIKQKELAWCWASADWSPYHVQVQ